MEDKDSEKDNIDKVSVLDKIFETLVSDASELVKDLYWSVKTYLLFGLISIAFGLQSIVYNIDKLNERFYIPLIIAFLMFFSGAAQIFNYFRLKNRYKKLFNLQAELKA